jgi:hypothetical protein
MNAIQVAMAERIMLTNEVRSDNGNKIENDLLAG